MDFQSHNLTIPRGAVLFAKYGAGTMVPGPYRDLGNCPEFTFSRSTNSLSHYSSKHGTRVRDAEINIENDLNATVTMDDISPENMAMWFMSNAQTVTIASSTAQTETLTSVSPGDVYQLGKSTLAPLGLRGLSNVVVTGSGGGGVTYDAAADYTIDAGTGLLSIVPGGAITAASSIVVTYDVAASTHRQMELGETAVEGELLFQSFNPYGPNRKILLPRVKISPSGDLPLMTDPESPAWQQLTFSISVLKRGNMPLAINADGLPAIAVA